MRGLSLLAIGAMAGAVYGWLPPEPVERGAPIALIGGSALGLAEPVASRMVAAAHAAAATAEPVLPRRSPLATWQPRSVAAPSISRVEVLADGTVRIEGLGTPGARVTIRRSGEALASESVAANGDWRITTPRPLAAGEHRIEAEANAIDDGHSAVTGSDVRIAIPDGFRTGAVIAFERSAGEIEKEREAMAAERRRRAEELAAAASDRFSELSRDIGEVGPSGRGPRVSQARPDDRKMADTPPAQPPEPSAGFSVDRALLSIQEWLERANREYQREIVRRLQVPAPPPETDTAAGPREEPPKSAKPPAETRRDDAEAARLAEQRRRADEERAAMERRAAEAKRRADAERVAAEKEASERAAADRTADRAAADKAASDKAAADRIAADRAASAKAAADKAAADKAAADKAAADRAAAERLAAARATAEEAERRRADAERQREAYEREDYDDREAGLLALELAEKRRRAREAAARAARGSSEIATPARRPPPSPQVVAKPRPPAVAEPVPLQRPQAAANDDSARRPSAVPAPSARGEREAGWEAASRSEAARRSAEADVGDEGSRDDPDEAVRPLRDDRSAHPNARCWRKAGRRVRPPGTYTVASGDNLWRISERHYRLGYLYPIIVRANPGRIADPDLIFPCQRLHLPRRRR